jgi:acyl carrier protein
MASLFARLLEIDGIETDDNFFDMGGTSILVLRLLSEVEQRWGAALELIDVVQHPTPELLAALATDRAAGSPAEADRTEPAGAGGDVDSSSGSGSGSGGQS